MAKLTKLEMSERNDFGCSLTVWGWRKEGTKVDKSKNRVLPSYVYAHR